jgi:hypothetical protein
MPLATSRTPAAQHHIPRDDWLDFRNVDFELLLFIDIFQFTLTVWATAQLRFLRLADFFRFRLLAVLELTFS